MILPRNGLMIENGSMQHETTTSHDFVQKNVSRVNINIPCNNIYIENKPFEGKTTTSLSYANPAQINSVSRFKPVIKYK